MTRASLPIVVLVMLSGCVSASPEAQKVRVTSNPEVVRGCEFLGNVKAMSGWTRGGSNIGGHNVQETLKQRTHDLGANTLYVVNNEGSSGTGEAYRCPAATTTTQ